MLTLVENNPPRNLAISKICRKFAGSKLIRRRNMITEKEMNSYRLTSMEEPTDEMLAQIMREAADIYRKEEDELQKSIEEKLRNLAERRTKVMN